MSTVWKPKDPELLKSWVKAIMEEASDKLTDWESRFVDDINTRLTYGGILTEFQENKLEEIYAEKTS